MSRSPKERLVVEPGTEESSEDRELYLRDGRKLTVTESGADQLVEIRSESGMVELRVKLTAEGPVLQMEAVKLQLKATEAVEIESKRVEVKATETLELSGGEVAVKAEGEMELESKDDLRVRGKIIYLN